MPKTVCLVMIVRNESALIARCLTAVWPHVSEWCIVDTGSEDTTIADIHAFVAAASTPPKPGRVHSRPWQDFGHNRTEALALARAHASAPWLLMIDADDILHCAEAITNFLLPGPAAYSMRVAFRSTDQTYRLQVFAREQEWVYRGRRHECPHLAGAGTLGTLPEHVYIEARTEGARSRNPNKYRDDALALEEDLTEAPSNTRALFYAAQSWRDAQEYARALKLYKQHAVGDGWVEERYVSCLNIVWIDSAVEEALRYAWMAVDIQPRRVEAAVALFARCRRASLYLPQLYAMGAFLSPPVLPPVTSLFVDPEAYTWKFADEFAQVALALGRPLSLELPLATAPAEQTCRMQFMARQASECADTATACTFADCLAVGARVYVHPVRPLFVRPLQLLQAWLRRAGVTVSEFATDCSAQLCFLDAEAYLPRVPLIVVATEQPAAYTLRMLDTYAAADWVWCMDNVDYAFLAARGCKRMKILPLMFGTYYMPAFMCVPYPHRIDVLQFGTKTKRRDAVMAAVHALRPSATVLYVDTVYDEHELSALLLATRVVVVPAQFADAPVTFGLHRLAFLMQFPEVAVVAEDAPASVYYKYILTVSGQVQMVPYERLAAAAVAAIDAPPPGVAATMRTAATRLLDWDGVAPWTSVLAVGGR